FADLAIVDGGNMATVLLNAADWPAAAVIHSRTKPPFQRALPGAAPAVSTAPATVLPRSAALLDAPLVQPQQHLTESDLAFAPAARLARAVPARRLNMFQTSNQTLSEEIDDVWYPLV